MPKAIVRITVKGEGINPTENTVKTFRRELRVEFNRRRKPVDAKARRYLRFTPRTPKYPIQWQSERQRRAFFASDGFGKGIPYKRTGELAASWQIQQKKTANGADIVFYNDAPHSVYVQGDVMQRMHIASGYHSAVDAVDKYAPEYVEVLSTSIDRVLEKKR